MKKSDVSARYEQSGSGVVDLKRDRGQGTGELIHVDEEFSRGGSGVLPHAALLMHSGTKRGQVSHVYPGVRAPQLPAGHAEVAGSGDARLA